MTDVSYAVMAHVDRADAASALAEELGADIAWDSPILGHGETANGDRAWGLYHPEAEWHVVLQDDALPVAHFTTHAEEALERAPYGLVSFYVGSGRPQQVATGIAVRKVTQSGWSWLEGDSLWWGVAVAMPTMMVGEFLEWGAQHPDVPYDKRLSRFIKYLHLPVRYTWPCLVDHADGATLVKHAWGAAHMPRRAWRVGVPGTWDTPAVSIV